MCFLQEENRFETSVKFGLDLLKLPAMPAIVLDWTQRNSLRCIDNILRVNNLKLSTPGQ